jgi:hypothetical protein
MRGGKEKRKAQCDFSSAKGEISSEEVVELIRRRRISFQGRLRKLKGEEGRGLFREGKGKLKGG